jgi:uncharacterized protein (UPF0333 family)
MSSGTGGQEAGNRKGQASLEYLMLSVVGLALVSFSLLSLSQIKSSMDESLAISRFRDSAIHLHNSISEVCAAGSGNQRTVSLSAPVSIETDNVLIRYYYGSNSIVKMLRCPIDQEKKEGNVIIENKDGKITLR